jgi:hypothetical protein
VRRGIAKRYSPNGRTKVIKKAYELAEQAIEAFLKDRKRKK